MKSSDKIGWRSKVRRLEKRREEGPPPPSKVSRVGTAAASADFERWLGRRLPELGQYLGFRQGPIRAVLDNGGTGAACLLRSGQTLIISGIGDYEPIKIANVQLRIRYAWRAASQPTTFKAVTALICEAA